MLCQFLEKFRNLFGLIWSYIEKVIKKKRKTENKNIETKRKREKGPRDKFWANTTLSLWPNRLIPNRYTSPSLSPADRWDPPLRVVTFLASISR
jgi:hypothetical protein